MLLGALLVVGALYNHYLGHSVLFFELVLLAIGASIALLALRFSTKEPGKPAPGEGLLSLFLARFLPKRWLGVVIPVFGFLLLLAWSLWKIVLNGQTDLRMEDIIVTLFSISLVLYHTGPSRFQTEKDFVVLYLLFLTVVFAGIWKAYTLITGESVGRVTAYSEYYFITLPVVWLVRLLGFDITAELDFNGIGLSNTMEFFFEGHLVRLGIGSGCSGLYSAGLFFSAFLAFVLVRYGRVDWRVVTALGAGLALTWASNILRMVVTVLVGALYGPSALSTFHMYFGILLFVALIAFFWFLVVRWLDKHVPLRGRPSQTPPHDQEDVTEGNEESAGDTAGSCSA